jgi:hypothetical protein
MEAGQGRRGQRAAKKRAGQGERPWRGAKEKTAKIRGKGPGPPGIKGEPKRGQSLKKSKAQERAHPPLGPWKGPAAKAGDWGGERLLKKRAPRLQRLTQTSLGFS